MTFRKNAKALCAGMIAAMLFPAWQVSFAGPLRERIIERRAGPEQGSTPWENLNQGRITPMKETLKPDLRLHFYQSTDIIPSMKKLRFVGSSLDDLKNFPAEARRDAGFELDAVQRGLMPTDFRPMLNVGSGAYEIRLHVLGEWRVIYVAKMSDAVYVLHAFQKKTQKTRREDIELAARRYLQIGG
jgi:phage-related protein